jgi:alkylation response protein AidB-like acyl-CoA dehydrogenase
VNAIHLHLKFQVLLVRTRGRKIVVQCKPAPGISRMQKPEVVAKFLRKISLLRPLVEEHRAAFDRDRRLPKPVFDAVTECDLLRLWVPEALGGPELSPLDFIEVVEAAAELDASVGWVIGNGAGMSRAAGYLPADIARDWFSERTAFVAAATGAVGTATKTEDGYVISGRWPFASGIHHASKIMALCGIPASDGSSEPQLICCYLAPSDVSVSDTWHVSGLRGTGSCDFEIQNHFVPRQHTHEFRDAQPTQPGLIYQIPNVSMFAMSVSAVPLGIASSALTTFSHFATSKIRAGTTASIAEREIIQDQVGRADAILRAARAGLREAAHELTVATEAGGERLVQARIYFRSAMSYVAESSVRVTDMMAAAAGAVSIFETFGLERCSRDVHAAVKHIAMTPNNYITAGRARMGLDPGTSRF